MSSHEKKCAQGLILLILKRNNMSYSRHFFCYQTSFLSEEEKVFQFQKTDSALRLAIQKCQFNKILNILLYQKKLLQELLATSSPSKIIYQIHMMTCQLSLLNVLSINSRFNILSIYAIFDEAFALSNQLILHKIYDQHDKLQSLWKIYSNPIFLEVYRSQFESTSGVESTRISYQKYPYLFESVYPEKIQAADQFLCLEKM
jgi:hypothetical protein